MCLWSDVDVDEALAIRMGEMFPHRLRREWNDDSSHTKPQNQPLLSCPAITTGSILVPVFLDLLDVHFIKIFLIN